MPSTTAQGQSRIVPLLKPGAGVVTEYGVADVYGKNLRPRAKELIRIAHPLHQEALEWEAHRRFGAA